MTECPARPASSGPAAQAPGRSARFFDRADRSPAAQGDGGDPPPQPPAAARTGAGRLEGQRAQRGFAAVLGAEAARHSRANSRRTPRRVARRQGVATRFEPILNVWNAAGESHAAAAMDPCAAHWRITTANRLCCNAEAAVIGRRAASVARGAANMDAAICDGPRSGGRLAASAASLLRWLDALAAWQMRHSHQRDQPRSDAQRHHHQRDPAVERERALQHQPLRPVGGDRRIGLRRPAGPTAPRAHSATSCRAIGAASRCSGAQQDIRQHQIERRARDDLAAR